MRSHSPTSKRQKNHHIEKRTKRKSPRRRRKVSSKKELGLGDQEATHHTDSILSTGRPLGKPSVEENEESCEKRSLSEAIPESLKGRVEKDSEVSSIPIRTWASERTHLSLSIQIQYHTLENDRHGDVEGGEGSTRDVEASFRTFVSKLVRLSSLRAMISPSLDETRDPTLRCLLPPWARVDGDDVEDVAEERRRSPRESARKNRRRGGRRVAAHSAGSSK